MCKGEIYLYYAIGVCVIICLMLIFLALSFDAPEISCEKQTRACMVYLCLLGYTPYAVRIQKELTIPLIFTKEYRSYNQIQKRAGLNLGKWRGQRAVVYCCEIRERTRENESLTISLYMRGYKIIAGDIHIGADVHPLCAMENLPYDI